jgi:hypothetical protein
MKTLKQLLTTVTFLLAANMLFAAETDKTAIPSKSSKNTALLASPRYLENHPELLRGQSSVGEAKTANKAKPTENIALANSPRFREAHPELRWTTSSADQMLAQNTSQSERLSQLTQNKALAASPRFLEQHPELLHSKPVFEMAPFK